MGAGDERRAASPHAGEGVMSERATKSAVAERPLSPQAETLRSALAKDKRIAAWQITSTRRSGYQTYLVKTQLESARRTAGEVHNVSVFVKHGDVLGRANVVLGPGD